MDVLGRASGEKKRNKKILIFKLGNEVKEI
jgi:hypothetical protein